MSAMPMKRPLSIVYWDMFQKNYRYTLTEPEGKNFDPTFRPHLTPRQMLELGIFGGAYFVGVKDGMPSDLPKAWFSKVRISESGVPDKMNNMFHVSASQSLEIWKQKGWIFIDDPHGWFQWYCRYYMGRRIPEEDQRQIRRWKAIRRHIVQIQNNCRKGDLHCRPRQRQAVLQWGYDARVL
jgi:hypothetical protein